MNHAAAFSFLLVSTAAAAALGCGATSDGSTFSSGNGPGGTGGASSGSNTGGSITVGAGTTSAGSGGGEPEIAEVFGHSPSRLYRLDPTTSAVTVVGDFQGCSDVIDIALDESSQIFGTTFGALYRIDKTTAVCTLVSNGTYPNSLSFVPEGTVDASAEALVGYNGSTYVRIDTQTGAVTEIGGIAGGYASSGDIVSVKNGKTLLTVVGPGCGDCIVEVNPTTGDLIQSYGPVGYASVYGLAFWAGKAFGFSDYGDLFEVSFNGSTVTSTPIAIPGAPTDLQFYGAGSTTSAPPVEVPD